MLGSDCSLLPSTTQLKTLVELWLDSVIPELFSNLNVPTNVDGIVSKLCRLVRKLLKVQLLSLPQIPEIWKYMMLKASFTMT